MRAGVCVIALYAAVTAACAGGEAAAHSSERVATGVGRGYRGDILVAVRSNSYGILEIEALEHEEDEFIGGAAIEALIEAALDANSADVDAVTGATETSEGFLEALRNALGADE
jgi:uncharacterized protein with FMN-binding domain